MSIEQWLSEHRKISVEIKALEVDREVVRSSIAEYVSEHGSINLDTDEAVMSQSSYRTTYSEKVITQAIAVLHRLASTTTDMDVSHELVRLAESIEDSQKTTEIKPYLKIKHK